MKFKQASNSYLRVSVLSHYIHIRNNPAGKAHTLLPIEWNEDTRLFF